MIHELIGNPMTNHQLATQLEISPSKAHFHLKELERAGLVRLVSERPKGGVIEKYFEAVAANFTLDAAGDSPAPETPTELAAASLASASEEFARAATGVAGPIGSTRIFQNRANLTRVQVAKINELFDAINAEIRVAISTPAADGTPFILTYIMHPLDGSSK